MTILYENDMYAVEVVEDALDEDNRSRTKGYGIFNKETGVREGTSIVYGEARWRADQFRSMIAQLDERANEDPLQTAGEGTDDDVTIN